MAKKVLRPENIKRLNNSNVWINLYIKGITPRINCKNFHHDPNDEDSEEFKVGHYFTLVDKSSGKEVTYGKKFITNKRLLQVIQGVDIKEDEIRTLVGCTVSLENATPVNIGDVYETRDGEIINATVDFLDFSSITVEKIFTAHDMVEQQRLIYAKIIEEKMRKEFC